MDRGDRSNLRYGQFGDRAQARYARGDTVELPDWLCPGSDLGQARSPVVNGRSTRRRTGPRMRSDGSAFSLRKEAAGIPEKIQKTALVPPRTGLPEGAGPGPTRETCGRAPG